jgi:hypothetical protein
VAGGCCEVDGGDGVYDARRGKVGGALGSCDHGGHDAREGAARGGREHAVSSSSSQYGRGRVVIIATAMVPPRASEHVTGVEERVAMLDAGVGVQGWAEATARVRALARPGRCLGALTACLARSGRGLGVRVVANALQVLS